MAMALLDMLCSYLYMQVWRFLQFQQYL
uniref:Uncharacterized protein n=1 Tax=Arundo donax TaxID=35708 RepID=A0A0A9CKQ0_ARUDO